MIIFLHGKDGYRLKQSLDKIIEEYKKKHASGMSFSVLDASDGFGKHFGREDVRPSSVEGLSAERLTAGLPNDALEKLEDLIKTTTFFKEKRLVVIRSPFLVSKELAVLIKKWELAEDKERIIVGVEFESESELTKKDKYFYALLTAKPNVTKSFDPLVGKLLEGWVVKETAGYGKKIDVAAVQQLILRTGGDSWLLNQEIDKLVSYREATGGEVITVADVNLLVASKEDPSIFGMVDAVANRNRLRAIRLMHNRLESDTDPFYIFSMIIYQFRNLLRIKDLVKNAVPYPTIIKKTGLNPFVVKKTFDQCRGYDLDELKALFAKLADLDLAAKNGETDITDGLYKFVFSL